MKTTIEMAREAWAEAGEGWVADAWFDDRAKAFEAFAKLVRADEREGTSMTKYEEQIRGMAQQNRGSVGMQEARPQPEQEPVAWRKQLTGAQRNELKQIDDGTWEADRNG